MKQLTCEMCGGTELVKQDGIFVCQSCGTKYSVEEAKKMMVEGTVEVAGTVKVDNSSFIENYFVIAKNAYETGNKDEAETYCNKIIEIDVANYSAWFLKGKVALWQATADNNKFIEAMNCFNKVLEYCPPEKKEETKQLLSDEVLSSSDSLLTLYCDHFIDLPGPDTAELLLTYIAQIQGLVVPFMEQCEADIKIHIQKLAADVNTSVCTAWTNTIIPQYTGGDNLPDRNRWLSYKDDAFSCVSLLQAIVELPDIDSDCIVQVYKNLIDIITHIVNSCSWKVTYMNNKRLVMRDIALSKESKEANIDNIMKYHEKIKELDPNYIVPKRPAQKKGCYVATAVYGSYDCPPVWTLRRYRDTVLAATWYGRLFISVYYAISPTLVKCFGSSSCFTRFGKKRLDKMVKKMQSRGIESTPYQDTLY